MAQWITRLTTDQKIPGSNPGELEVFLFFFFFNSLLVNFLKILKYIMVNENKL